MARSLALAVLAAMFAARTSPAAVSTSGPTTASGIPEDFVYGICKVHSDTGRLSSKIAALQAALDPFDATQAAAAVEDTKSAITAIQAELDQLPNWADGQLTVTRFREVFDKFQEGLNLFTTGLSPLPRA